MASIAVNTETTSEIMEEREESKCGICWEILGERKVVTTCGHKYCSDCFFTWFKSNANCPLCRKKFLTEEKDEEMEMLNERLFDLRCAHSSLRNANRRQRKRLRENKEKADSFMDRQIRMMDLLNETRVRAKKEFAYLRKIKQRRINFSFDPNGRSKAEEKMWNDYQRDWEDLYDRKALGGINRAINIRYMEMGGLEGRLVFQPFEDEDEDEEEQVLYTSIEGRPVGLEPVAETPVFDFTPRRRRVRIRRRLNFTEEGETKQPEEAATEEATTEEAATEEAATEGGDLLENEDVERPETIISQLEELVRNFDIDTDGENSVRVVQDIVEEIERSRESEETITNE